MSERLLLYSCSTHRTRWLISSSFDVNILNFYEERFSASLLELVFEKHLTFANDFKTESDVEEDVFILYVGRYQRCCYLRSLSASLLVSSFYKVLEECRRVSVL